jgi:outer membrane protein OmpA-like peptidoglycan-associated protein
MNRATHLALLLFGIAAAWSCAGPERLRTPERPGQVLVVLLPDGDTGTTGRATVSNPAGTAELAAARDSTSVAGAAAPTPVTTMTEAEVRRIFGAALAALPPPPRHFTLFFRFESDEPTDEGRALIPTVLQAVTTHPFPEVTIVGHTDTTGSSASNFELGLKRASAVRELLVAAGLDASLVELVSHGEADLLVPTADEVAEPRNRRVEISVR